MPRVFEPFFTTKPGNKGTGLGLYNARVFVERHRGLIAVNSAAPAGAEFSILFPEADFAESPEGAGAAASGKTTTTANGSTPEDSRARTVGESLSPSNPPRRDPLRP